MYIYNDGPVSTVIPTCTYFYELLKKIVKSCHIAICLNQTNNDILVYVSDCIILGGKLTH